MEEGLFTGSGRAGSVRVCLNNGVEVPLSEESAPSPKTLVDTFVSYRFLYFPIPFIKGNFPIPTSLTGV